MATDDPQGKRSIALIGFRGSGKSTVGRILAARTGLPLIDTDEAITERAGRTISEIFNEGGEAAFRALEAEAVERACAGAACILALGGGAVESDVIVRRARATAMVVWLRAGAAALSARIAADPASASMRPPLLGGRDTLAEIDELLQRRTPLYAAAADVTMDTDECDPEQVADAILARLGAAGR